MMLAISLVFGCKQKIPTSEEYGFKTFYEESIGWGYDIMKNGKLLIHQPHIPAANGIKGFDSEKDAKKVAELMIEKIDEGIFPPSITLEELKELKIKIDQ